MIRTWTLSTLSSCLLTFSLAASGSAGEPAKPVEEQLKELKFNIGQDFQRIEDALKAIRNDITLKTDRIDGRIIDLERRLKEQQNDMDALKRRLPASDMALPEKTMQSIQDRLAQIDAALVRIQNTRVSMSAPSVSLSPAPVSGSGRLLLVNNYTEDMLFVVNGSPYRVLPGTTVPLDRSAGTVTYEVISPTYGLRGGNVTTLNPRETLTITAYR